MLIDLHNLNQPDYAHLPPLEALKWFDQLTTPNSTWLHPIDEHLFSPDWALLTYWHRSPTYLRLMRLKLREERIFIGIEGSKALCLWLVTLHNQLGMLLYFSSIKHSISWVVSNCVFSLIFLFSVLISYFSWSSFRVHVHVLLEVSLFIHNAFTVRQPSFSIRGKFYQLLSWAEFGSVF